MNFKYSLKTRVLGTCFNNIILYGVCLFDLPVFQFLFVITLLYSLYDSIVRLFNILIVDKMIVYKLYNMIYNINQLTYYYDTKKKKKTKNDKM